MWKDFPSIVVGEKWGNQQNTQETFFVCQNAENLWWWWIGDDVLICIQRNGYIFSRIVGRVVYSNIDGGVKGGGGSQFDGIEYYITFYIERAEQEMDGWY